MWRSQMRDDFTQKTIEILAHRAGYRCSYPDCRLPTRGAASDDDGTINIGVAAHITAASPAGPRYDSSLTSEQRKHHSNGIWLCETHAKLVDSDETHFTVEMLVSWKQSAEQAAFKALVGSAGIKTQRESLEVSDTLAQSCLVSLDCQQSMIFNRLLSVW
jgi:hypothetical protein